MMKRKWKVMLWVCRECPSSDPEFEDLGGEEGEEAVTSVKCGITLSAFDVLFLTTVFVLGCMQALKPIFYYWRMI